MANLGDRVHDRLTGFTGIVTAYTQHLYRGARILVIPELLKNGKPEAGVWLDADRVDVMKAGAAILTAVADDDWGPPMVAER